MSQESKFNEEVSNQKCPKSNKPGMVNIRCDRTRFIFEVRKEKRWQLLDHTGDFGNKSFLSFNKICSLAMTCGLGCVINLFEIRL